MNKNQEIGTSSLRVERRPSHSLREKLVLVLNRVFLLGIGENRSEPFLVVVVDPGERGLNCKFSYQFMSKSEKTKRYEPVVEIGGEIDEGLEA